MDKEKIGRYLKELRQSKKRSKDGKSFTQSDVAEAFFDEEGIYISPNSIKDWEIGKTFPSIDNLIILSKIYDRTIDELLEGEDKKNIDYKNEYFIFNNDWMQKVENKNKLYSINQEQIIKITKRFKELVKIRIKRQLSTNEEEEFIFLFENFYNLTDFAKTICKIDSNDDYCKFKSIIYQLLEIDIRNMNPEEKFWELRKLYNERESIRFCFQRDVDSLINGNEYKEKRFDLLDDWQKDMYLAMYQNIEPYDDEPDRFGADHLKIYEKMHGCEYNRESILKEGIKELIKRGACCNNYFLNVRKKHIEDKRIIDRLEELYNLCLKPIEILVQNHETDGFDAVKIENNMKNRFINNYYFSLSGFLGHKISDTPYDDLEETYNFFINNEEITDELRKEIAKKQGIDVDREYKYWFADYKFQFFHQEESVFYENKRKEKEISDGLLEIERLKKLLEEGTHSYTVESYETIGGNDEESIRDYIEYWKSQIDYSEYLHNRDHKLTASLLKDLDNLSFKDIREKYFKEVSINE